MNVDLKSTTKEVVRLTDTKELEIEIKRSGITKRELAKKLGLSEMGLYKKIHNITEFKASEVAALTEILSIEEKMQDIFFATEVD